MTFDNMSKTYFNFIDENISAVMLGCCFSWSTYRLSPSWFLFAMLNYLFMLRQHIHTKYEKNSFDFCTFHWATRRAKEPKRTQRKKNVFIRIQEMVFALFNINDNVCQMTIFYLSLSREKKPRFYMFDGSFLSVLSYSFVSVYVSLSLCLHLVQHCLNCLTRKILFIRSSNHEIIKQNKKQTKKTR